jgi:hypothetical protein
MSLNASFHYTGSKKHTRVIATIESRPFPEFAKTFVALCLFLH